MESEVIKDVADILIHVDEDLDDSHKLKIANELRKQRGVVSVLNHEKTPHLFVVKYKNNEVNSSELLASVCQSGIHAELVGI